MVQGGWCNVAGFVILGFAHQLPVSTGERKLDV